MKKRNIAKIGGLVLIINGFAKADVRGFVDDLSGIFIDEGYTVAINDTLQPSGVYTEQPETTKVKFETGDKASKEIRGTKIDAGAAITVNKRIVRENNDTSYVKMMFADEIYNSTTDSAIQTLNTNPLRRYEYVSGPFNANSIAETYFKIKKPSIRRLEKFIPGPGNEQTKRLKGTYNILGQRNPRYGAGVHIQDGKKLYHRKIMNR